MYQCYYHCAIQTFHFEMFVGVVGSQLPFSSSKQPWISVAKVPRIHGGATITAAGDLSAGGFLRGIKGLCGQRSLG